MQVDIDPGSGFCFGVVTAITKAEQALALSDKVYSLGDIVHNAEELHRLEALGLKTLSTDNISTVADGTLIIRAHGEPPATYRKLEQASVRYIDATCPVVAKLQSRVKQAYERMKVCDGQVVILGKRGHAEVVGLTGQIGDDCIVVECDDDLRLIDFDRPVCLLSQTTQSLELFGRISREITARACSPENVTIIDTICRQVANRESGLREFASRYDIVIFVCGKKSSNGKVLFEVCRSANPRCHCVESGSELRREWFDGASRVGICGATSTPKWLMQQIATQIESI